MAKAILALALLLLPQDAQRWAAALANFQKLSGSRDGVERGRAAEELGNATNEKHDRMCWQLVSGLLRVELNKEGPNGKSEEKVSGDVTQACLGALRKITHKDVLAEMVKVAKARGEHPRVRAYCLWAVAAKADLKDLTELVEDKQPVVQVAAVDALAERADASSAALFIKLLTENLTWEMKLSALRGLEKGGDEKCVDALIEGLGKCRADEGRLKDQYLQTLKKLVGVDVKSDDPNAWKAAWTAKKDGKEAPEGATMAEPTEFYGLKTRSTRIVFVLDRTGSMAAPGSEPARTVFKLPRDATGQGMKEPKEETFARDECTKIQKKWADRKVATRMEVAKKELINTVYILSPRVHFNVVWYESVAKPWKPELVPATWMNKLDCIKDADRLDASGSTNIWEGLETAFKMVESPQRKDVIMLNKNINYASTVGGADTFFLMTDGQPTEGRIQNPDEILAELRKVNQLRKVTIHSICVGDVDPAEPPAANPNPVFLKKIADENGGDFMHLKK
jgi:hypothetical protein